MRWKDIEVGMYLNHTMEGWIENGPYLVLIEPTTDTVHCRSRFGGDHRLTPSYMEPAEELVAYALKLKYQDGQI